MAVLWTGVAAADSIAPELGIRVLLLQAQRGVEVGVVDGPVTKLEPAPGGGLRADGRRVGPVWRLDGALLRVDAMQVRGNVEVHRVPAGLAVVNRVPLEDYVTATVGSEVYPGWAAEMLKAQAVATRTYALYHAARRAGDSFHLEGGTRSQVYGGFAAESPEGLAAVRATRGEYLAWQGEPILAVFHSASGGRTASSEEVWGRSLPYLVSVPVENEEDSPDTYWRAPVSGTTLGRALASRGVQVGPVQELRVLERSPSGRARLLRARGRNGETEIEARALREALGAQVIRSTLFEIRKTSDGFVLVGSGHGHGVGMSQWGAQAMARGGASYREILAAFYPGAKLVKGASR